MHRRFGRRVVVHDLSLRVAPGEVVGLLGPNGAGKTTTFRMLAGLLRPHRGEIRLDGRDITRRPLWRRARAGLGYLPQQSSIFRRLTVAENVDAGLRHLPRAARAARRDALLADFGLAALAGARGETLSGGERRRVELVRAFAAAPRVLLVDEPFAGLDPRAAAGIADHLARLADRGVGVLLTDHDVRQALEVCARVYILAHGEVLGAGPPAVIRDDPNVRARYLGDRFDRAPA
ncbi:MAG: LPS export ABC transporter ATP-binding protein [Myxococcales bacterium]|nr:LPS export ABC transporter ATP-binding protein [Myxococcales bacterium]